MKPKQNNLDKDSIRQILKTERENFKEYLAEELLYTEWKTYQEIKQNQKVAVK